MPSSSKAVLTGESILRRKLTLNQVAVYWLCQAGFVFKTASKNLIYIDPYFSDLVERVAGFKRLMACPIDAEQADANLILCTHEHPDHMDTDALPVLAKNPRTNFVGPIECVKKFRELSLPEERCFLLEEGAVLTINGVKITGVFADHGEYSSDALGIVLDLDGIRIYHTGDTAFRPDGFRPAIDLRPDILIPCINGRFNNMNEQEAALLTQLIRPSLVIPCHFGMFAEHNGDPARFVEDCADLVPELKPLLMNPGEEFIFEKSRSQRPAVHSIERT